MASDHAWRWTPSVAKQADGLPSSSGMGENSYPIVVPSLRPRASTHFELFFNDLMVGGFSLGDPVFAERIPQAIREAARMIEIQEVTVPITAIYPLDEIKAGVPQQ